MIFIGADNGLQGGIAVVNNKEELLDVFPMPVIKGNKRTEYDMRAIIDKFKAIKAMDESVVAILEQAHARPISGRTACFSTGMCYGIMRGILNALDISCVIVTPNRWMKQILAGTNQKDKKGSIKYCLNKYPAYSFKATERCTKYHDGCTDAVCLALWGVRNIGTQDNPIRKEL